MTEPWYFYCIVFFTPTFMLSLGLIFLFKKDWAWAFTEYLLRYVNPQRTPEWERSITQRCWILVAGGIITFLYLLSKIM